MKKLMNIWSIAALSGFANIAFAGQYAPEKCAIYAKGPEQSVSFFRLIAMPEKFDNAWVKISGYVGGVADGFAYIHPSKESGDMENTSDALVISLSGTQFQNIIPRSFVEVSAIFKAGAYVFDTHPVGFGELKHICGLSKIHLSSSRASSD